MSPSSRRFAPSNWASKASVAAVLLVSGCSTGGSSHAATSPSANKSEASRSSGVVGSISSPLGLRCVSQGDIRHCSPETLARRVPSFDGTPLDVDVYLPAGKSGRWPTLAVIHGYGGSKDSISQGVPAFLARKGYAVLVPTMRGFGKSCGPDPATRGSGCANGWIHNADQRYEVRDVQTLLGWLVDEHVARASAIGVTGASYGGGISLQLAYLKDRIRLENGRLQAWRSPAGTGLGLKAAWARSAWSDLASVFAPNGRVLDGSSATGSDSLEPQGVPTSSNLNELVGAGVTSGWVGPLGSDGKGQLGQWAQALDEDPMSRRSAAALAEMHNFHSAVGLKGALQVPVMLEAGWTDDLFPPRESLRVAMADSVSGGHRVSLVLGDLGHPRAQNRAGDTSWADSLGLQFLDKHLKGLSGGLLDGTVAIRSMHCDSGPDPTWTARSWSSVRVRELTGAWSTQGTLHSGTSDSPAGQPSDQPTQACARVSASAGRSGLNFDLPSRGLTMLGLPTVNATVRVTGGPAQVVARLWDVGSGQKRLITRGVVRLTAGQSGLVRFQLNGNAYAVPDKHTIRLELVGADPPVYRADPVGSAIEVESVRLNLPIV